MPAVFSPSAALASNDPFFGQQWGLAKIQAESAWGTTRGDGITVAVLDTGVAFDHEDLAGQSAGSFTCLAADPCQAAPTGDDGGHGSWVAGIVAGNTGNSTGIAAVAPGARILSVKVLGADGTGDLADVIRGVRFAADNGARIINLSLGPEVGLVCNLLPLLCGDPAAEKAQFQDALNHAASKGAIVVAAAGNDGVASFYEGMQNVVVVGATNPTDQVATYSNGAEIYAPGGAKVGSKCTAADCIVTTNNVNGQYIAVQGTSFAAPHVAGIAAQLYAIGYSGTTAISRIISTADTVGSIRRVNAARAVGAPPPSASGGGSTGGTGSGGGQTQTSSPPPSPTASQTPRQTAPKQKAQAAPPPPPPTEEPAAPPPSETQPPPPSPLPVASPPAVGLTAPSADWSGRMPFVVAGALLAATAAANGGILLVRRLRRG